MDHFEKISPFLYYTYLPFYQSERASSLFPGLNLEGDIPDNTVASMNESDIIEYGIHLLKSTISTILEKNRTDYHIVPLSGGLDSRGILASLIDAGLRDQIIAVTFGTPGSWNYELGSGLAKKFNFNHKGIDLEHVEVSTEKLLDSAQDGCSWTFLIDGYYNSLIPKEYGQDVVYWSGFIGGALAGFDKYRLLNKKNGHWEEAKKLFAQRRGFLRATIDMSSPEHDPVQRLPVEPILENPCIKFMDQLWLFIHNINYLERVVVIDEFNYQTPYCSSGWVKFMLSLSDQHRINKYIYKKILHSAYPDFFSYPISKLRGGSLNSSQAEIILRRILHKTSKSVTVLNPIWNRSGIYRDVNYIDFNRAIRERDDYKKVVFESISDLKARKLIDWFDPEDIWKDHINKNADLGIALVLLTALEISLKSEELSI